MPLRPHDPHPGIGFTPDGRPVNMERLNAPEFQAGLAVANARIAAFLGAARKPVAPAKRVAA